jgi:hypothetical protein
MNPYSLWAEAALIPPLHLQIRLDLVAKKGLWTIFVSFVHKGPNSNFFLVRSITKSTVIIIIL